MKFKVGDKVRGIGTFDGKSISAYTGVIVAQAYEKGMWLVNFGKSFSGHKGTHNELMQPTGWNVDECNLELVDENVKIIQDGNTVIAIRGKNKGIAKCNPADKFELKIGIDLALKRLDEQIKPFELKMGDSFFHQITMSNSLTISIAPYCPEYFTDELDIAMGNVYRTKEEAEKHSDEVQEKMYKLIEYAKTL